MADVADALGGHDPAQVRLRRAWEQRRLTHHAARRAPWGRQCDRVCGDA
jgi:hypothetical protein